MGKVVITVKIDDVYDILHPRGASGTGYVAWGAVSSNGDYIAGIYRGFGRTVACARKPMGKGWRGCEYQYVTEDHRGRQIVRVRD